MSKVHDRIFSVDITCDESADTVIVDAVEYYRDRGELDASNPFAVTHTAGVAAAIHETELGEVMPPPNIIRINATFQA